jgi:hypothetical protein
MIPVLYIEDRVLFDLKKYRVRSGTFLIEPRSESGGFEDRIRILYYLFDEKFCNLNRQNKFNLIFCFKMRFCGLFGESFL